jgi:uncharacterized protein
MLTRRQILQRGVAVAGGLGLAQVLAACDDEQERVGSLRPGYGPLSNHAGPALALPAGFTYVSFGAAAEPMSDDLPTPTCHDGTGYFEGPNGTVIVMRNHEGFHPGRAIGTENAYDPVAQGGVTLSRFDPGRGKLMESGLVLNGTDNNCNGGVTPWGTWLSGEENTVGRSDGFEAEHGYIFEVPIDAKGPVEPVPIKQMGRFVHEAAPVDPKTGIVYMTEDNGDPGDGFYRYLPDHKGKLHRGGELQMLAVQGKPRYDTAKDQRVGRKLECTWVTIKDPDPSDADERPEAVYEQGRELGGARFLGLEGAFFAEGAVYFTASEAGDAGQGQIWRYRPDRKDHSRGDLTLLYESPGATELNQPDGIAVSPRGGVVLLEDGDGEDIDGGDNWIRGLDPDGKLFDFAKNTTPLALHRNIAADLLPEVNKRRFNKPPKPGQGVGASEFAGAGFSPDGHWLFVNVQYPGETYAITGPWQRGWL